MNMEQPGGRAPSDGGRVSGRRKRISTRRLGTAVAVGSVGVVGGVAGAAALPDVAMASHRYHFASGSCKVEGWVGAVTVAPHYNSAWEGAFRRCSGPSQSKQGWGRAWFKHVPSSPGVSTGTNRGGLWGTGFAPASFGVRTYAKLSSKPTNQYHHHFSGGYATSP